MKNKIKKTMKAIVKFNVTKKGIDFNGSMLYNSEINPLDCVYIGHTTKSGYKTKKPLYLIDFNISDIKEKNGKDYILLTDNEYNDLVEKFRDVKFKHYYGFPRTPPSAAHAIANFITKNGTDPYDVG